MPPIWDTLIRPGQQVAQSTSLFTQYPSGSPHTSPAYHDPRYGLRSWSKRSYVDPRTVSAMMGDGACDPTWKSYLGIPVGILMAAFSSAMIIEVADHLSDGGRRLGYRWTDKRPMQEWIGWVSMIAGVYGGYKVGQMVYRGGKDCQEA